MKQVQVGGNAFVNGTLLRGHFVQRSCALHEALTCEGVEAIVKEVSRIVSHCPAQTR